MKIAIDISPLKIGHFLQHRVRGTGFYIENLKRSLLKYFPENEYHFFVRGEKLPKDLEVVHYPYFEPFFLTLPFFNQYRTIITVHDLTPLVYANHFPAGLKGKIKWQIQKFLLERADRIIADSISSKNDILKFTGVKKERADVVYLAAAEDFKQLKNKSEKIQNLRKKYDLPEKFVLYVGDVTWNKNLPRLIRAIKMIDVNLVLVGKAITEKNFDKNNPWNQDLIEVQKLIGGNKRIKSLGFVTTEDLVILYHAATVFAMPSLYEGFGLPVLEAMSCGCPIITSKEGSLKEVAGEAAYYVNAYDPEEIALAIEKVYKDLSLQASLINKGLNQVKNFTWKKTAEATIRTYEKKN